MTSKPQLTANRTNAKKSTGPKTKAGKSIASSNAVKHGATAKHFIGGAESQAYQAFLAALQQAYPNKNPLVAMQLERIAKIKIHLERVQSTIDATFEMAREEEALDEKLMNLLDMDQALINKANLIVSGEAVINEMVSDERIKVANELSSINVDKLKTQEDFLNQTPQLCQYLFTRSHQSNISILNFINSFAENEVKKSNLLNETFDLMLRSLAYGLDFNIEDSLVEAVQKVDVETLRKAANLYKLEIKRLADAHYKITAFSHLREIPHLPIALNLETLDKLYRYQSTLQRQLSNCIGELLVLNKSTPPPREISL